MVNLFKENYRILRIQGLEFKIELVPARTAEQKIAVQRDTATKRRLSAVRLGKRGGCKPIKVDLGFLATLKPPGARQDAGLDRSRSDPT